MLYTKLSGMCHVKDPSPFAIRQTSSASCPLSTLVTPRSELHIWYNRHSLSNNLCHLLIYTLSFTHLFNIWHFRLFISVFESYCLLMRESFESFTQHSFRNKTSEGVIYIIHSTHSLKNTDSYRYKTCTNFIHIWCFGFRSKCYKIFISALGMLHVQINCK